MIKNWLNSRREKFQAWLDKPARQRTASPRPELLAADRERPWQTEPIRRPSGRPDPIQALPRTPLRTAAKPKVVAIKGKAVTVSETVLDMLKDMDRQFLQGLEEKIDWLEVRTERRMARNQEVATRQGGIMFPEAVATLVEGSHEEAEFVAAQKAMIIARAKHASNPSSADTASFMRVTV